MAKKCWIERDKKRRRKVLGASAKRNDLRKRFQDKSISDEERMELGMKLNKMQKNSAPARIRNRCLLTGRSRGYYRRFRVSRIVLREMASAGMLPGVIKASW